jgi:hypothetical protein
MDACTVCGNRYDKLLEVVYLGVKHHFDSFECAIHHLAPHCSHCGIRVIGHGVEMDQGIYCSAHCSRSSGKLGAIDRIPVQLFTNSEGKS